MLRGLGCISPRNLPTPARGRGFFCYLSSPSALEGGMPWGPECFCLLMVYLKGPERKRNRNTRLARSLQPAVFLGGKNQHTVPWLWSSADLGTGLQAGDPLALRVSSPVASCTLWTAEEDPLGEPGWEWDAPTSAVISRGAQPSAARKPTQLPLLPRRLQFGFNHVLVITGLQPS